MNGEGPTPDKPPTPDVPKVVLKPGEVEQKAVDEAAEEVKGATAALEAAVAAIAAMPDALDEEAMDAADAAEKAKCDLEAALKVSIEKKEAADAALVTALNGPKLLDELIAKFDAALTQGLANFKETAAPDPAPDPTPAPAPAPAPAAAAAPAPAAAAASGDKEMAILEVHAVGKVTKRGSQKALEEVEQIILVLDARKVSHANYTGGSRPIHCAI